MIFLQDNCPALKAKDTMSKISEFQWNLLVHLPYSPNLASSDYYLFRNLKNDLLKKKFVSVSDVQDQVSAYFKAKSKDWFLRGFDMQSCAKV